MVDRYSEIKNGKMIKKGDVVLLCIVLCLLAVLLILFFAFRRNYGGYAEIYVKGQLITTLPLNEDVEYRIETEYGFNILKISDGKAYVLSADCPDEVCVHTSRISRRGDTIYCLPHELKIVITGDAPLGVGD